MLIVISYMLGDGYSVLGWVMKYEIWMMKKAEAKGKIKEKSIAKGIIKEKGKEHKALIMESNRKL